MSYSDYKYYKPTFFDKLIIEGSGSLFAVILLAGIWLDPIRWKLIFTSLFFLVFAVCQHKVIEERNREAKASLEAEKINKKIKKVVGK